MIIGIAGQTNLLARNATEIQSAASELFEMSAELQNLLGQSELAKKAFWRLCEQKRSRLKALRAERSLRDVKGPEGISAAGD